MLNKLKKITYSKIQNIINNAITMSYKDIDLAIQRRALESTVDYINKNMTNIQSVKNKFQVIDYALSKISNKKGLILEFGVYKCETINYLAKRLSNLKIFGFDSFEGLPENWRDGFPKGTFSLNEIPNVEDNVVLIKGWFEKSIPDFIIQNQDDIVFLHIDCDLYSSTNTIFNNLKNQIKKGTVIVFDEYFNYPGWENGEFKAFQEFVKDNDLQYRYLTYNKLNEQVAIIIL